MQKYTSFLYCERFVCFFYSKNGQNLSQKNVIGFSASYYYILHSSSSNNKNIEEKRIEITRIQAKRADKVKLLGVLIDDRLSFKNHDSGLQKQVSMATGMLNRVSKIVPVEVKLKA